MASFIDELKSAYKSGNVILRLIFVNVAVYVGINIIYVILSLFTLPTQTMICGGALDLHWLWLAAPADLGALIYRPWTLITYMFGHGGFWHLAWNMMVLYFAGRIFIEYLGSSRVLATYVLGGLAGIGLYLLFYNVFPLFSNVKDCSLAIGASASVMAVLIAVTAYVPRHKVNLIFIGAVELRYIAIFLVVMDIINIRSGNAGGHISHLGGAAYGYFFVTSFRKGSDWSAGFNRFVKNITAYFYKSDTKMKVSYSARRKKYKSDEQYNYEKKVSQQQMDEILDKISKSGYESLSKEEKDILFKFGNKD